MRSQIFVSLVLLSLLVIPLASPEGEEGLNLVASKPLPEQSSADIVIHEHFLSKEGPNTFETSSETVSYTHLTLPTTD